jgi:hypothetical protein
MTVPPHSIGSERDLGSLCGGQDDLGRAIFGYGAGWVILNDQTIERQIVKSLRSIAKCFSDGIWICRAVVTATGLHLLIGRLRPHGSFGSSREADCVGSPLSGGSNRAANITARLKGGQ